MFYRFSVLRVGKTITYRPWRDKWEQCRHPRRVDRPSCSTAFPTCQTPPDHLAELKQNSTKTINQLLDREVIIKCNIIIIIMRIYTYYNIMV